MSTQAVSLTAAAIAFAALAYFMRGDVAPSSPTSVFPSAPMEEAAEHKAAALSRGDAPPVRDVLVIPPRAEPTVEEHSDGEPAAPRRVVLRGTVTGTRGLAAEKLELLVQAGIPARFLRRLPVSGDGPFEVDLTEELPTLEPEAGRMQDRVSVLLQGEGYEASVGWAAVTPSGRLDETRLAVTLVARPLARTLRGRILTEVGGALSMQSLVEFVGLDVERAGQVSAHSRLARDGAFALEVVDEGAGTLIIAAEGHAVLHVAISADQVGDVELGELELPKGAVISGRALARAGELGRGGLVLARAPHAPALWYERVVGLQCSAGRVHRELVTAKVERDGRFELVGLEPGFEYQLSLVPARLDQLAVALREHAPRGVAVTAPSRDITLESSLVLVRVVVEAGGEPVRGVELAPTLEADDERGALPEALRQDSTRANNKGELIACVDPRGSTQVRITAPSHAPREVALDISALEIERETPYGPLYGPLVIDLGAPLTPAVVEWRLDYDGPGSLVGAELAVRVHTNGGAVRVLGPVALEARDGADGSVARLEDAPLGPWAGAPILLFPTSVPLADLPLCLELFGLTQVTTRSGEVTVVECALAVGARIEVRLQGRDPALPPPTLCLVEVSGNVVRPALLTDAAEGAASGHRILRQVDTDGPVLLDRCLPPGVYRVRAEGEGYETAEAEVDARRGEVSRVTLILAPRRP